MFRGLNLVQILHITSYGRVKGLDYLVLKICTRTYCHLSDVNHIQSENSEFFLKRYKIQNNVA